MPNILDAYKDAIDLEKKLMTENELAEFEQKLEDERKIIEEHEKTMVRHDDEEFILDERGVCGNDEDDKYPDYDDPEELIRQTKRWGQDCQDADEPANTPTPLGGVEKTVIDKIVTETELMTERTVIRPVLIRAYCPQCGKEIVSMLPPMFNPFTMQKVNVHKCGKCGWVGNLEHSYPRVVFIDAENNEYDAYTR